MDIFNLQAAMPVRRLFCSILSCSRCPMPNVRALGNGVTGCVVKLMHLRGGEGARPNCFIRFRSRIHYAKCGDLFVFVHFILI
jgi:hypothetical protein